MNVIQQNDKIIPLPIGLENDKWIIYLNKRHWMLKLLEETKKSFNLVYCNFNINTNVKGREECWNYFNSKCSCWVTMEQGKNGEDFPHYIRQIYNHSFIVCPEGNGLDTVRAWESLYMNSIPIIKRREHWKNLEGKLPICLINDWSEVTEQFLNNWYQQNKKIKYCKEILNFNFWKNLIIDGCK
jgi:hypothetical protein